MEKNGKGIEQDNSGKITFMRKFLNGKRWNGR